MADVILAVGTLRRRMIDDMTLPTHERVGFSM